MNVGRSSSSHSEHESDVTIVPWVFNLHRRFFFINFHFWAHDMIKDFLPTRNEEVNSHPIYLETNCFIQEFYLTGLLKSIFARHIGESNDYLDQML